MRTAPLLVLATILCACGKDGDEGATNGRRNADTTRVHMAVYAEPEAAGVLRALSEAEIAAARVARDVTLNHEIRRYSEIVMADHRGINELVTEAMRQTGASVRDNASSVRIRATGDSVAQALAGLPSGFNNTYIEEQIKAHERVLQELDTALLPSARSPQLRTLFEQIRPTLIAHLQRARQIMTDRRRAAAERGEDWESGIGRARAPATAPAPPAPEPQSLTQPTDTAPKPDSIPITTTNY